MNKRGMQFGIEIFFILSLLLSFFLAFVQQHALFSYVVVIVVGTGMGSMMYNKRQDYHMQLVIVAVSFLLGYLTGMQTGSRLIVFVLFSATTYFGYRMNKRFKLLKF